MHSDSLFLQASLNAFESGGRIGVRFRLAPENARWIFIPEAWRCCVNQIRKATPTLQRSCMVTNYQWLQLRNAEKNEWGVRIMISGSQRFRKCHADSADLFVVSKIGWYEWLNVGYPTVSIEGC